MIESVTTVEILFRRLIDRELTACHGPSYWKHLIPGDIKGKVKERIARHLDRNRHLASQPFQTNAMRLEFCDVPDYRKILSGKATRAAFKQAFPSLESLESQLVLFTDYRNAHAHNRTVDVVQETLGSAVTRALLAMLERLLGPDAALEPAAPDRPAAVPRKPHPDASVIARPATAQAEPDTSPTEGDGDPAGALTAEDAKVDPKGLHKELNKVWRKLDQHYDVGTLAAVERVDPVAFAALPAVGALSVSRLAELKVHLRVVWAEGRVGEGIARDEPVVVDEPVHLGAEYELGWLALASTERSALAKLAKGHGVDGPLTANRAMELIAQGLDGIKSLGEMSRDRLRDLATRIEQEARRMEADEKAGHASISELLVPIVDSGLTPEKAEALLLLTLERFLERGPSGEVAILRPRWGLDEPQRTLADIGKSLPKTRTHERIRQVQREGEKHFRQSMPARPVALRVLLEEHVHQDLAELMPTLAQRFDHRLRFLAFLEAATEVKSGWLKSQQTARTDWRTVLDRYFVTHSSPVPLEQFLQHLRDQDGWTGAQASHTLRDLILNGRVAIVDDGVEPCALSRGPALAHALLAHPKGMHWSELADAVNQGGYAAATLSTERPAGELTDSPMIVWAGRGTYRHVHHIGISGEDVERILGQIKEFLATRPDKTANLQEAVAALWPAGPIEYFQARYVCTTYGEADGLHGKWQSSADTISLTSEPKSRPTIEVIASRIEASSVPVEASDLLSGLRVPTEGWVSLLLFQLVEADRVVEVERDRYSSVSAALARAREQGIAASVRKGLLTLSPGADAGDLRDLVLEETGQRLTRAYVERVAREERG